MSKGQNQLLQAAIQSRRLKAEEARDRQDAALTDHVEATEPLQHEEVGPVAEPIKVDKPSRSTKQAAKPIPPKTKQEVKVEEAIAGPLTNARKHFVQIERRFKGNLLEHPTIESELREMFDKVQMGEDRIIVSNIKQQNLSDDDALNVVAGFVARHPNFEGDVHRGTREGRFRIIARNKK